MAQDITQLIVQNWSARRSGGCITIHGEYHERSADGGLRRRQVKVTGVDSIMIEGDKLIAIDRQDAEHELGREWIA